MPRLRGSWYVGLTVSLQMRYHRPVPLETPLRILARVTGTADRKISVSGSFTSRAAPDTSLVTADGTFVGPDPHRARAPSGEPVHQGTPRAHEHGKRR
ncbi:hotdog domain-containing protein [Streptomyces cyanogenus]|uniref:hotdog domain-containing protein n=1 Tax=Streptomyces cyanogenus TaxID=80860 RepID=UPI001AA0BF8F